MMSPRKTRKANEIDASQELGNTSRNERQKTMLLCEINRLRRTQVQAAVEEGKRIMETSKKLCEKEKQ